MHNVTAIILAFGMSCAYEEQLLLSANKQH